MENIESSLGRRIWRLTRSGLIVVVSVAIIGFAFRIVGAGSLTPLSAPTGTMQSLDDIYTVLVGNFDSSGVVASKQGNALQITKCIIGKINNTPCP